MNVFQWLTVPPLAILAAIDLARALFQRPRFRGDRVLRAVIWTAGAVAIYDPMVTVRVAHAIGIERGTDLIVYVFALAFLGTSFFFYARTLRLQRQITELVRHLAIRDAERGPPGDQDKDAAGTAPSGQTPLAAAATGPEPVETAGST